MKKKNPGFKVDYMNEQINELISKCEHKTLVIWACDCAEHVMKIFEKEYPQDKRPGKALEAGRAWIKGELSMWNARKFAFPAHASAREVDNLAAKAVARACGQAVGTVHISTHSPHCAIYAAQAVGYASGDMNKEREWQYSRLVELFEKQNR